MSSPSRASSRALSTRSTRCFSRIATRSESMARCTDSIGVHGWLCRLCFSAKSSRLSSARCFSRGCKVSSSLGSSLSLLAAALCKRWPSLTTFRSMNAWS
eukprot:Amastigsp_a512167_20.p4 type:complete len:100 gc:universal Amastigsp_a512167_20:688-987(+)